MRVRVAEPRDLETVFALRREVFCDEQGLFEGTDEDAFDREAVHLIAEDDRGAAAGTVRLFEKYPGVWYGGRLAVRAGYRGGTGFRLVRRAVTEAAARGAADFLAEVQDQNERFFQRLGWDSLGPGKTVAGVRHVLMRAPLQAERRALGLGQRAVGDEA